MRCWTWLVIILMVILLSWSPAASAKKCKRPVWVLVPSAPGVEYCPNMGLDLFRIQNHVYYYNHGNWHLGAGPYGPWRVVRTVPQEIYLVEARYFKTPPGWAKGKKNGWHGKPLPPGKMKKLGYW